MRWAKHLRRRTLLSPIVLGDIFTLFSVIWAMVKNYIIHQYWGVVINPLYNNPLWGFLLCDGWPFDPGRVLWVTWVVTSLHFLDVKQWYYHFSFLPLVRRPQFSWWWLFSYHFVISIWARVTRWWRDVHVGTLRSNHPSKLTVAHLCWWDRKFGCVWKYIPPTWHFELGTWSLSAGFGAILFTNVEMALVMA